MKRSLKGILLTLALLIGSSVGCKSTTSYFMQRFDDDKVTASPNGELGLHQESLPFRGIPVTLRVATHVDIKICESMYFDSSNFDLIQTNHRNLHAEAEPVYSDKIFSVDPKKAAAGDTKYNFEFDSENEEQRDRQYFKKITQKITDETIKDLTGALDSILPLLQPPKAPTTVAAKAKSRFTGEKSPVIVKKRTVAFQRFDINAVDFEDQVKTFVESHINKCGPQCPTNCSTCGTHP